MKCRQCLKLIPDGFTDCPWCGATQPSANSAVSGLAAPASESPSGFDLLTGISLLLSAGVFATLQYLSLTRQVGQLTLESSAYFLGRCAGFLILAALVVVGYYKIRQKPLRSARTLFVTFTTASLVTFMNLSAPSKHGPSPPTAQALDQFGRDIWNTTTSNKWTPAARSLLLELVARNKQYVSDVSALDTTAKPLYTPASFSTAAGIQQIIDQLNARMGIADKYSEIRPVFAKMKDYVSAVDASAREKREFMDGYESTLPKTLAAHKALVDKEHAWLQSSLDLYQFVLSKQGTYVYRDQTLVFKKNADSGAFNQKLLQARMLKAEFLQSYWDARRAQQAMIVQMGLEGTEFGPMPPRS